MSSASDRLLESPLEASHAVRDLVQLKPPEKINRWIPSRFNARSTADDGSLILWNTYTGAISVFRAEQSDMIKAVLRKEGFAGELKGVAKYLKERGFIVSEGTNEYRRFQYLFGNQHYRDDIMELILLASEDCNFRCVYCYEEFPRGTMAPSVRQGVKSLVEKRIKKLKRLGISWFGGEPLYGYKAVQDLAPFFHEITEKHSVEYTCQMTTNAYLLTPDISEQLVNWRVLSYQITIDGLPEHHDRKRPTRDGGSTFDRIFSNLRAMRRIDREFLVKIRVNYDRENSPHLEDLLVLIEKEFKGDQRFTLGFHGVGKWGGPNDAELNVCGTEGKEVRNRLDKSAIEKGLSVGNLAQGNLPGNGVCYAARPFNFIVGADGKLMKCTVSLDKDDNNVVGRIGDDGEMELDIEKLARWVEPVFESDLLCQKCYLLPSCQGMSCPLIRFENGQSPCAATVKPNLRNEMNTMLSMRRSQARLVQLNKAAAVRLVET